MPRKTLDVDCDYDMFPLLRQKDVVVVVCPRCSIVRSVSVQSIRTAGHHFCKSCARIKHNEHKAVVGQTFGRLTVIDHNIQKPDKRGRKKCYCACKCSCGNFAIVERNKLLRGFTTSCGCYRNEIIHRTGKEANGYDKNKTDEQRASNLSQRQSHLNLLWKRSIYELYGNRCAICGGSEKLHAHHIESFAANESLRFDLENGICLCKTCHSAYHISFMKGYKNPATRESFDEFLAAMKAL